MEIKIINYTRSLIIKYLSVNNPNFSPLNYVRCQMMQCDVAGKGLFIANQDLSNPVEP